MSGGTPTGGGYMRQRHSQGYASSGDDLEDDACSRTRPTSPSAPRNRTWIEILENFLWIASAVFIIYYGDRRSNLIYLLLHDDRIRRINGGLMRLGSHVRTDESLYILYVFTGLSLCGQELCSSVALLGLLYKENQEHLYTLGWWVSV